MQPGQKKKKPERACRYFPCVPKEPREDRSGVPQLAEPQTTSDGTCARRLRAKYDASERREPSSAAPRGRPSGTMVAAMFR